MVVSLAPFGGSARPAVWTELPVERGGQRTFVAGGEVGFDVFAFAHARNDGVHIRIVQNEAQGHFRHGHTVAEQRLESVGASDAGFEIFRNEISAAPIVLGPSGIKSECAGKRAFIKWHAGDDRDVFLATCWEKFIFGILIEDVVNDLDCVDAARAYREDSVRRLPAVKAEADGPHFSAAAQLFDGARDTLILEPPIFPSVKLNKVEGFDAEILEALVHI